MKLEYKILWLDDKIAEFIEDDIIDEVNDYLVSEGFSPTIVTCDVAEDFFNELNDSYDIILTDFHMNDMNGDEVVEKIRWPQFSVMTEILFYTARADLKDTKKISRVSFLETNSTTSSHIDAVLSNLKKLIDLTIKKTQHLNNLRWLVMAEASEIENIMKEIVNAAVLKYSFTDIDTTLCGRCSKKKKTYHCTTNPAANFDLRRNGDIVESVNKSNVYSLLDAITKMIWSGLITTSITTLDIQDYTSDMRRNILAHSFEISSTDTEVVLKDFDWNSHTFVKADFKHIRQNIKKYRSLFESIKTSI